MRGRGPSWGAGFALPGARTIVIRVDGGDPHGILRHELAHLALHEAIRVRVPLWFDEGTRPWLPASGTGSIFCRSISPWLGRRARLLRAGRSLRATETTAQTAYALARIRRGDAGRAGTPSIRWHRC
jgi:hypothetical protein